MAKVRIVVKKVKRMRLFGVNIVKEVRKLRLFGKDIWTEVDISDHYHDQPQPRRLPISPPALLQSGSALAARRCFKISPVAIPAVANPYALLKEPSPIPAKIRDDDHDHNKAGGRRKIKIKIIPPRQPQPPQLPVQVRTAIEALGGTELVFLTNKKVEMSDVDRNLNRLFVPNEAVTRILKALTAEEKEIMGIRGDKVEKEKRKRNGGGGGGGGRVELGKLGVRVVDGNGNVHDMDFKKWPSLGKLLFLNQWYKFAQESELEAGVDSIQLWCFRDAANSGLGFAVVKN